MMGGEGERCGKMEHGGGGEKRPRASRPPMNHATTPTLPTSRDHHVYLLMPVETTSQLGSRRIGALNDEE